MTSSLLAIIDTPEETTPKQMQGYENDERQSVISPFDTQYHTKPAATRTPPTPDSSNEYRNFSTFDGQPPLRWGHNNFVEDQNTDTMPSPTVGPSQFLGGRLGSEVAQGHLDRIQSWRPDSAAVGINRESS